MQDQVKTDTGYNYGGTSYQNQERTDSQGNKYTVAIPISSVTTAPQQQFQTPTPQAPTNYGAITTDLASQQDFALQQFQNQQDQMVSDTSKLQNALLGEGAFRSQQAEATGLNAANQAAIQKSAEISALGKQAAAAQQENISQGRQLGSVSSFVAGQGAEIERNRAIKALSLGAELDAIQGNIAVAQSKVDQAVEAQYAPMKQALANKLQMFELNKTLYAQMSDREQKLYSRAQAAAEKEQKKLDQDIADKKEISNLITDAIPNAPTSVIANAKKLAESGASKLAVAQALGVYGGDYLKNELLKEQLKTEKAQRAKIYADMNAKSVTGPIGQISTATDIQNATANLKLNEGQSKALAFGQRAINADKAMQERLKTYDPTTIFSAGGRLLNTDNARAFERDLGDFITAVLRKESGATITEDEFNRFIPLYSPQGIMTNQTDVVQTNLKRQGAIDALISEAGPASSVLSSYKNSVNQSQFVSTGNTEADEYIKNSMNAVSKVNTSMTTPNAMNAGYVDNQK